MASLTRSNENSVNMQAGMLSLLVHAVLFTLLFFSLSLKTVTPTSVAEVQLWDALPATPPKVVSEPEPKIEPKPKPEPVIEEKPAPEPEPKAEIQLKKEPIKPPKIEKPIEKPKEQVKPEEKPKKQTKEDALKKLQQAMLAEDTKEDAGPSEADVAASKAAQAALKGEVNKYAERIKNKIYGNINRQLCGEGKPNLVFGLSLMPTGDLSGQPKRIKGSGINACDEAIERAILQSAPFTAPPKEIYKEVRDMEIKFRPNDDN